MTLNVSLPPKLENMVHEKVNAGLYQNPSELVHEALKDFFSKPTEGQVLAYIVEKRLKEIEENGEVLEEVNLSKLQQLRQESNEKRKQENEKQL